MFHMPTTPLRGLRSEESLRAASRHRDFLESCVQDDNRFRDVGAIIARHSALLATREELAASLAACAAATAADKCGAAALAVPPPRILRRPSGNRDTRLLGLKFVQHPTSSTRIRKSICTTASKRSLPTVSPAHPDCCRMELFCCPPPPPPPGNICSSCDLVASSSMSMCFPLMLAVNEWLVCTERERLCAVPTVTRQEIIHRVMTSINPHQPASVPVYMLYHRTQFALYHFWFDTRIINCNFARTPRK